MLHLKKNWFYHTAGLVALVVIAWLFVYSEKVPPKNEEKITKEIPKDLPPIPVSPYIPDSVSFAGELVPIQHEEIKERMERELLYTIYNYPMTSTIIKRSNRWKGRMMEILKNQGIPEDFYYMMLCESAVRNLTSSAGAKGYWQFLPKTAQQYGLQVDLFVDERLNPMNSTLAACKYLKDARQLFGNWTLVAASYNMGMNGLQNNISAQKAYTYYDLYLNAETSRYVFRIIALKLIMNNPEKYGFKVSASDLYNTFPCRTIAVSTPIFDLVGFAKENGTSYKMLRLLNPWLINTSLPAKGNRTYEIVLPASKAGEATLQAGIVE